MKRLIVIAVVIATLVIIGFVFIISVRYGGLAHSPWQLLGLACVGLAAVGGIILSIAAAVWSEVQSAAVWSDDQSAARSSDEPSR